jgi:hypothetical protein
MKISMKDSKVTIDGRDFNGSNVTIINGRVTVDGVVQDGTLSGNVSVVVHGDVDRLENASGTVKANNVGSIATKNGDIECGDVNGSVQTMSGDVSCGKIGGSVSTMSGDVTSR